MISFKPRPAAEAPRYAVGHGDPPTAAYAYLATAQTPNPTTQIAQQQEAARAAVYDFQFTHRMNAAGRWINNVTGADETHLHPENLARGAVSGLPFPPPGVRP